MSEEEVVEGEEVPMTEIMVPPPRDVSLVPRTGLEGVLQRKNMLKELIQTIFVKDVHYGVIPGTGDKPTILKPGSEAAFIALGVSVEHEVEDLSDIDEDGVREIRVRVISRARHIASGLIIGEGVGECSSNEDKYKWRRAVCEEEWNDTPDHMRRKKYKAKKDGSYYVLHQIRTNPSDVGNTVLKIGKKRGDADCALTITNGSEILTQDVEDMNPELLGGRGAKSKAKGNGKSVSKEPPPAEGVSSEIEALTGEMVASEWDKVRENWPGNKYTISVPQQKRLFAIAGESGWKGDEVKALVKGFVGCEIEGIPSKKDGPYDLICSIFKDCAPTRA